MKHDINEVLNFLSHYATQELQALRRQHPVAADVLLPNHFGVSDPALELRAQAALLALKQLDRVIARGLARAVQAIASADRMDDWASLTTALGALCSAFAALADAPTSMKLGAALFTLVSSVVALLAKRQRRSLFSKDLSEHIKTLSAAQVAAPSLRSELDAYLSPSTPKSYDAKVGEALAAVNTLLKSINLALIDLGLESGHA